MTNVISLILLNLMYFMCNIYPKHIIEINSPLSVFSVAFNILFYILFALFLIISIHKNKTFFSCEKFGLKNELKKILLICAIQIGVDVVAFSCNMLLRENVVYVNDFATIVMWILIYNICATKESNIFRNNKKSLSVIIIFAVLLLMTSYGNYKILEAYSLITDKFYLDFIWAKDAVNNFDFLFEIKNFLLDTIVGIVLLVFHSIRNKDDEIKQKRKQKAAVQIVRITFMVVIALGLIGIKSLVLPCSCIKGIDVHTSTTQENLLSGQFYVSTTTTTIKRIDTNFSVKNCFQKTSNQIFYNGKLLYAYASYDRIQASSFEMNGNQIAIKDCFVTNNSTDVEFCLYKNEVLCFVNDGVPIAIHNTDAPKEFDEDLTLIYKDLIQNNNWNFFEQASEYLLEYDRGFIEPYLTRFSIGAFDDEEIISLNNLSINKEYIQHIASELL